MFVADRGNAGMSDVTLDVNPASSPIASHIAAALAEQNPGLPMATYRGVLTPVELDARPREIEALVSGAAVHDLGWRRRVAVRGEDRVRWLSGMVTNMVKDLPENGGAWNLVLNAQGRIQGDLTVWRDGDDLEVEVAADQYERLMAHLEQFIIMDDVELAPVEGRIAAGLSGPKANDVLASLGVAALSEAYTQADASWNGTRLRVRREYGARYSLWIAPERAMELWNALEAAGARPAGSVAVEAVRIAEGVPAYGIDIAERDLPQETSQTRALHFNKGCYLGQEIVERIRSRGNVHRHLRALELDGPIPAPGTELLLGGAAAGRVTSAAELPLPAGKRIFAMGMIRAEAEARNQPLEYAVGEMTGQAQILSGPPTF
jgi:folate-binding protein YgfZ